MPTAGLARVRTFFGVGPQRSIIESSRATGRLDADVADERVDAWVREGAVERTDLGTGSMPV